MIFPICYRLIENSAFFVETDIYSIDLFKLLRYVERSKIGQKLHGFNEKSISGQIKKIKAEDEKGIQAFLRQQKESKAPPVAATEGENKDQPSKKDNVSLSSPLIKVCEFISSLVDAKSESRILINISETVNDSAIKFCLMNPSSQLADVVKSCRSLIVAGGTMQPMSEFKRRLFGDCGVAETSVRRHKTILV